MGSQQLCISFAS